MLNQKERQRKEQEGKTEETKSGEKMATEKPRDAKVKWGRKNGFVQLIFYRHIYYFYMMFPFYSIIL